MDGFLPTRCPGAVGSTLPLTSIRRAMRLAALGSAIGCAAMAGYAAAADLRFGYQVGASQSVGTTISNNEDLVLLPGEGNGMAGAPVSTSSATVTRLEGIQLTTGALLNLTLDILTPTLDHALLIGGTFTQLIPVGVPQDAALTLNDRVNIIAGNARYLARIVRPRWGFAFGGGYDVTSNGRVCTASDGAIDAFCLGTTGTNPGNRFVVNGLVHRAQGEAQLQLTRERWDLDLEARYAYTVNGALSLVPGANTQQDAVGAGTNLAGFVRLTSHEIQPTASYRHRVGARGVFTTRAASIYTIPNRPRDMVAQAGTLIIPENINNDGQLEYIQNFGRETGLGAAARALFSVRVPTDPSTQTPFTNHLLQPDSLITQVTALWTDFLPGEIRTRVSAGAAQPWIFQPPLGVFVQPGQDFATVRAGWTPIFEVGLSRRFDPLDLTLNVARTVGPGALGVSALVNESAGLVLTYTPRFLGRAAQLTAGANVNQTRGVGRNLFQDGRLPCDMTLLPPGQDCPLNALQLSFNNRGIGANAGLGVPIYTRGQFTSILTANYNFAWLDPDPDGVIPRRDGTVGRPPFTTHTAIVTIALLFGRGPLQGGNAANQETQILDPFSVNPATGAALSSARLLRQNQPLLDGTAGQRPGEAPEPRRDSKQAYEESRRQAQIEREARERSGVVTGNGTIQEEEERAAEREAAQRKERQEKRTRKFSEWPLDEAAQKGDAKSGKPAKKKKPKPAESEEKSSD